HPPPARRSSTARLTTHPQTRHAYPMRRRLLLLLPLLALLCATSVVTYGLTRPRAFNLLAGYYVAYTEVASDACLFEGDPVAGSYHLYGVHTLSDGFIIFYAVECSVPGQPNKIFDGDRKYQLRGLRWTGVGRGMRGHALLPAGTLADYQVSLGDER